MAQSQCMQGAHLDPFASPAMKLETRGTDANIPMCMPPALFWVVKPFDSDPGASYLLHGFLKLDQSNLLAFKKAKISELSQFLPLLSKQVFFCMLGCFKLSPCHFLLLTCSPLSILCNILPLNGSYPASSQMSDSSPAIKLQIFRFNFP